MMFNQFQRFLLGRKNTTTITVNRDEQKQLLKHVLNHSHSMIKHYSISDPDRRYTDLMLAPTLIEEAITMLNSNCLPAGSLLVDFLRDQ